MSELASFAQRLLAWFDQHGRHDLPWKQPVSVYRVWVSEIMLQQTQVTTVIGYFQRFMQRFPTLEALASAPPDEVLHYWSGLGYYARARNLQRTAQLLVAQHQGQFPQTLAALQALPGIGRSTAAAILAQALGQRQAILDGNVKRVLARHAAIDGWPGTPAVTARLWALAEMYTPEQRVADYTQAIMDLGALLCTRSRPSCLVCPVMQDCQARQLDQVPRFPAAHPKRQRPQRSVRWLIVMDEQGQVLLQQRPPAGIWGGLWSFPESTLETEPKAWCEQQLGVKVQLQTTWPRVVHQFSHFSLEIEPLLVQVVGKSAWVMDDSAQLWYNIAQPSTALGLAAPVQRLLQQLSAQRS